MEAPDRDGFNEIRCEFRGGTSDAGAERGMGDGTVLAVPGFEQAYLPGSPMSYVYPKLLYMPGHLHIIYNALENAVKSAPYAKEFLDALQSIQAFLSIRHLRMKFRFSCLHGTDAFDKFKITLLCISIGGGNFFRLPLTN